MTVLWVKVPDEPGPGSMRAFIERNSIALLSKRFASLSPDDAEIIYQLGLSYLAQEKRIRLRKCQ
jgi:hypothetical protein